MDWSKGSLRWADKGERGRRLCSEGNRDNGGSQAIRNEKVRFFFGVSTERGN